LAVKIRLFRVGKKKNPMYRVVVMDSRKARNSRYIEKIGFYNPLTEPAEINIDKEKAMEWLNKGAVPTDTVFNLFQKTGIALEYHLQKNKADDKTRQIELQKWELAKKEVEDKKRKEAEEKLKKLAEEETVDEPVVEPEADEVVEETEKTEEATEKTPEEPKEEEKKEE
jgi:small subunit ribosomal protein S16